MTGGYSQTSPARSNGMQTLAEDISDQDIAAWLRQHPQFFVEHPELLDILKIPHPSGIAVSLIEHQLKRLREKNQQLLKQIRTLIHVARKNEQTVTRLHYLALELINAESLNQVIALSQDVLRNDFRADRVVLRLIDPKNQRNDLHFIAATDQGLHYFSGLFQRRKPLCGRLRPQQTVFLFGEDGEQIQSAVLLPLYDVEPLGILALGSHNQQRFHSGMGTLFLRRLGEMISRAIVRYL